MRVVLSIAASDSSGAAGLQADLMTIAACGGHAASVVTAVTAQNRAGIQQVTELPGAAVAAQLRAVLGPDGLPVAAVKSGVLGSAASARAVARALRPLVRGAGRVPYVLDPVLVATSGRVLLGDAARRVLEKELLGLASLLTPNAEEAAALLGCPLPRDREDAARAGRALLATGADAVLVKGGHLVDDPGTDVLVTPGGVQVIEGPLLPGHHTRGTGCSLASAIAAHLARGRPLLQAVRLARRYLAAAIAAGVGEAHAPDRLFLLREPAGWRRTLRLAGSRHE